MENKRKNFEENYVELVEFCKRENRLPNPIYGKEENRLCGFTQRYKDDLRIVEIREKYSKNKSFDENIQDLIKFCERENRLPHPIHGKEESRLKGFIQCYKDDLRIVEIKEKYSKNKSFDENLQDLIEFCKKEGRLPNPTYRKEEGRLKGFMKNHKKDPRIIEIREYYCRSFGKGKSKFEESLKDLIEFCKKENRLPQSHSNKEEGRLRSFIQSYKDDLRIVEIREKYSKNKSFDENLQDLIEFCERENRLPQTRHGKEGSRLDSFMKNHKKDPRIIEIKKKYTKYSKRGA